MGVVFSPDRRAATARPINSREILHVRKNLTLFVAIAATIASLTLTMAQDKGGPPQAKGPGRGAKKGPAGPLPRLSDGKPDLTGVWNGFAGGAARGAPAPNIQPWAAKVIADRQASQGAEDFEARCLPGGPPRAAPYHTSFFATPKLVLMLFKATRTCIANSSWTAAVIPRI